MHEWSETGNNEISTSQTHVRHVGQLIRNNEVLWVIPLHIVSCAC